MNQRQVFETRLERYCRLKRLSPLTFKKHSFNLAVFCNWLGRKEFNKLNCQNFIIFLQDKGWKVNSINSAISTLKVLTQQLADNGDIEEDFSHKLKVLRQDPFSPILLTQNEVFAIINCPRVWGKYHKYIDRRKYDLYFELLACCALRRAEVLNLRVRDFDFTSNTFRILGKGRKVRTLPIPKLMREKLKIWVMEKGDYDNFIFSGSKGGRMGISTFRDELKKE